MPTVLAVAYLVGRLPLGEAILWGLQRRRRWRHLPPPSDLRAVLSRAGVEGALLLPLAELGKGWVAASLALWITGDYLVGTAAGILVVLGSSPAAVARYKRQKMALYAGALLALFPAAAQGMLALWLVFLYLTRQANLAGYLATLSAVFILLLTYQGLASLAMAMEGAVLAGSGLGRRGFTFRATHSYNRR